MTIQSIEKVRSTYARSLNLDPWRDHETAIQVTAQILCIPNETVREVVEHEVEATTS